MSEKPPNCNAGYMFLLGLMLGGFVCWSVGSTLEIRRCTEVIQGMSAAVRSLR